LQHPYIAFVCNGSKAGDLSNGRLSAFAGCGHGQLFHLLSLAWDFLAARMSRNVTFFPWNVGTASP
jgi:hypothetical protein